MKMAASQKGNGKFTRQNGCTNFSVIKWPIRLWGSWSPTKAERSTLKVHVVQYSKDPSLGLLHCVLHYGSGRKMRSLWALKESYGPGFPQWASVVWVFVEEKFSLLEKSLLWLFGLRWAGVWLLAREKSMTIRERACVCVYVHNSLAYQHAFQSCQRMNRDFSNVDKQLPGDGNQECG